MYKSQPSLKTIRDTNPDLLGDSPLCLTHASSVTSTLHVLYMSLFILRHLKAALLPCAHTALDTAAKMADNQRTAEPEKLRGCRAGGEEDLILILILILILSGRAAAAPAPTPAGHLWTNERHKMSALALVMTVY